MRRAALLSAYAAAVTPEHALVVALIRAVAQPTPDRVAEVHRLAAVADLERVLGLLAAQRMITTLGGRLLDDPAIELTEPLAEWLGGARMIARHRGMIQHALTGRLARTLEADGLAVVALKGTALADSIYGNFGARQSSDIDLLVPGAGLDRAVDLAGGLGWTEPDWSRPIDGLPELHRVLDHPDLPPLELHWRVHWYESTFAQAALDRATINEDGSRRLLPTDELSFLLLFLARDGFAGLRQTVDVAAWWASLGRPGETAAGVRTVAGRHPELAPALAAAAEHAETMAGLARGSLIAPARPLARRERAAVRLANPWREGSRQQVRAEISLVDGLLSPSGGLRAFARRRIFPPDQVLLERRPELRGGSRTRMTSARLSHAIRVVGRYAWAPASVIARGRG